MEPPFEKKYIFGDTQLSHSLNASDLGGYMRSLISGIQGLSRSILGYTSLYGSTYKHEGMVIVWLVTLNILGSALIR